jgi:hypothetical protein
MGGWYVLKRYPKFSKNAALIATLFAFTYLLVYFFIFAPQHKPISKQSLETINGSVTYMKDLSRSFILRLKEYPAITFTFDQIAYTGVGNNSIRIGDTATILALKTDIKGNKEFVDAYEFRKKELVVFSLETYNTSIKNSLQWLKIFCIISFLIFSAYLVIQITGISQRIKKIMNHPDSIPDVEKPNFNEYLEKNNLGD